MLKKACFFNAFLHRFSSIFDLKIHRFLDQISMHFAMKSKIAQVHETLRGPMNFEGRLLKNNIKIDIKYMKNEGAKKASQKALQKLILGAMLASKTSPKSKKNRWKIDIKTRCEKNAKKVPT